MRALIWKEWHENLKWAAVALIIMGVPMMLLGLPALMDFEFLTFLSIFAAAYGAAFGFIQVYFESHGDRRALLLHRPISHSQVFLAKMLAGLALYLLALGAPLAFAVGMAWAGRGGFGEPLRWRMSIPWLLDILTGIVYYFAGMLAAEREARWYGSRCLGLATGFLCSLLVWELPQTWQALLAIIVFASVTGVAAWGSFVSGGAYASQHRLGKAALAMTFLAGLLVLSPTIKFLIGSWFEADNKYWYILDWSGRVLLVHRERYISSVTDLQGKVPPELQGKRLDRIDMKELEAPTTAPGWPVFHSYRNPGGLRVPYRNESTPNGEHWYYVADEGRLIGYDGQSQMLLGSFGPDGFVPPDQPTTDRFQGPLHYPTKPYQAVSPPYLTFPGGVYTVDFRRRTIRTLFAPAAGQTVLWAIPWKDTEKKTKLVFVVTDKSVHVVDEAGMPVFSAPLAYDLENYGSVRFARLDDPERFVIWYEPSWYLRTGVGKAMPSYVVEYAGDGRELARQKVPPAPLAMASFAETLYGLFTAPVEAAGLVPATDRQFTQAKSHGRNEVTPLLYFLAITTQNFIPGFGWERTAESHRIITYVVWILLSALASALGCFMLARRFAFSRARRIGWLLCGLVFGPVGLLLLLAVQEWPARIACPQCHKPRLVTRETCEHCGATHAKPIEDGTEIFEEALGSDVRIPIPV
jgi:hypothetical protein